MLELDTIQLDREQKLFQFAINLLWHIIALSISKNNQNLNKDFTINLD